MVLGSSPVAVTKNIQPTSSMVVNLQSLSRQFQGGVNKNKNIKTAIDFFVSQHFSHLDKHYSLVREM